MKLKGYIKKEEMNEIKRKQEVFKELIKGKVSDKMQKRINECGNFFSVSSNKKNIERGE